MNGDFDCRLHFDGIAVDYLSTIFNRSNHLIDLEEQYISELSLRSTELSLVSLMKNNIILNLESTIQHTAERNLLNSQLKKDLDIDSRQDTLTGGRGSEAINQSSVLNSLATSSEQDAVSYFTGDDFTTILQDDHLHADSYPYDLLSSELSPGVRKLPSELDMKILQQLPSSNNRLEVAADGGFSAALTAGLNSIVNGDFSIAEQTDANFGWELNGGSKIENGQAVLTEDSPFLSNFTQTFTVPEEAKTLQFKLVETELGTSELVPPDAFEVALLDADTNESLVSDHDLTATDSLLNIQNDGNTYFNDKVRIGGAASGDLLDLDKSRTVTIDISHLAAGTEATLYFDLLGFGDVDSRVVIDDVRLSDKNLLLPIALDDTANTTQGQAVEIDILANDTDDDGVIATNSVEIQTEPSNGSVIPRPDGTVSYIPGTRFAGTDSFTYVVQDNDGQFSAPATVDVTVANVAPEITEIQIPDSIIEGVEFTLNGVATDAGNDRLTYSWEIDGQELSDNSQQINYTFLDNGTYSGSLTVSDPYGDRDTQAFEVIVNNAPPLVDAGVDVTIDEGSSIQLSGSYSDRGVNDTHTVTWDFGDGDTANTSEIDHTYSDDGQYTATYTVTDNDGAIARDTVEVTVNNVAPIIESLTGDTEINEGDTVSFNAIATDPGDDTITYIWDFGDGSEQLTVNGQQLPVSHTYKDNGDYTVTLTAKDEDGGETLQTLNVRVNNVAPTFDEVNGETEVDEGEVVNYRALATDPGDDELTYSWNFGEGTPEVTGADVAHTFTQNGTYDATVTVTDDDGASTVSNLTITVNNVAPTLDTESTATGEEGSAVTFEATFNDPGNDDLSVTWDFGDGSDTLTTNYPAASEVSSETQTHTYADNDTYIATVTITDSDGATTSREIEVTIANTAPVIDSLTGDTEINEGDTATFNAIARDAGNDELTYTWDFGDGSPLETTADELPVTHQYADNGSYIVTLTVDDGEGGSTSSELAITVNNIAPTIAEINGATEVNEGEVVNYNASATDPGDDELTYTWSFDGGTTQVDLADVNHVFAQDGIYDATVTVTDDDGASTTRTLNVTVNNVAPSIETDDSKTGEEGSAVEFNATIADPGTDALTITWDFGDGSDTVATNYNESPTPYEATTSHTYTQNGTYTATVTVTDSDGATTSSEIEVTVSNVTPVIESLTGDTEINEGDTATFNAIASDGGDDELTYTWDLGNGNSVTGQSVEDIYLDNGLYEVTLIVSDGDGGTASSNLTITVDNVAPAIAPLEDRSSDEGQAVVFDFSFSDPGILDTHTVVWDFGEGNQLTVNSEQLTVSHTYADNGEYTAILTVTDNDGASTTETVIVTVSNVPPTFTQVNGRTNVDEGELVNYSATATDPGDDELTYTWSFNNGASEVELADVNHVFPQDGTYDALVTVTDDDGASTSSTLEVTVNNVAPSINTDSTQTGDEGSPVEFAATFSDPGTDALTITWDFGDGTEPVTKNYDDSPTPFELTQAHTYAQDGIYNAIVTVTDSDGAVTQSNVEVTINNVAPTIDRVEFAPPAEGRASQFRVIATDPGDDTLTYTWDFGDGSESVTGSTVEHLYLDDGNYTITLTVSDEDGGTTTSSFAVAVERVFNLKAEGKLRINGRSDLDGEPLNLDDDTRIYAGGGFTINGNQTLPIQRDSNGNPITQGRKSVLIDRAVTVGPNYSESNANASQNKYVGIVPPQVIDGLVVNVPQHDTLIDNELAERVPADTSTVTFNPQNHRLNNTRDWENNFPAPGTSASPTLVNIIGGGLNIPSGVDLDNYVIIVEQGDLNFNGKGHDLDNVMLVNRNGSINLAEVSSHNLSVFAANNININSKARFGGNTTLATGHSNSNLNFNGATSTLDDHSNLQVISQGNITFNSSSTTKGNFTAARNFTANGRSDIIGSIQAKGDIRINGGINLQNK